MIANPAWRFFNFYVLRRGFLEGTRGLHASMAAAFYVFLKYAKVYERMLEERRVLSPNLIEDNYPVYRRARAAAPGTVPDAAPTTAETTKLV
jgi:hypothetical protein